MALLILMGMAGWWCEVVPGYAFPLNPATQVSPANPAPAAIPGTPAPTGPGPGTAQPSAPSSAGPVGAPLGAGDAESIGKSGEYTYFPADRRDPFAPVLPDGQLPGKDNPSLPPLQRLALSDLHLIGIIWGNFGYTAMLQAPDGKGYTIRRGAKVGPNNGVVSAITENAVVIEERFTDIYGKKQVREYIKRLHEKEITE
jgi:type IV pilus assembly protein PilP